MSTSACGGAQSAQPPDSINNIVRNAEGLCSNAQNALCRARDGLTLDRPTDHSLSYAADQIGKVINWASRAQALVTAARQQLVDEPDTAVIVAEAATDSPISDIIEADEIREIGGGA